MHLSRTLAILALPLLTITTAARAADPDILIDTKFDQPDDSGAPKIASPGDASAPLTTPTGLMQMASDPNAPTVLKTETKTDGPVKAPYLILQIGSREGNPTAAANGGVLWDLKPFRVSHGVYVISFDIAA